MSLTEIAALGTAAAGLIAALAQWSWLIGPRRNGHRARLHRIEDRLATTEAALDRCLERLRTARVAVRADQHRPRDRGANSID